jgi:hypothetical protein
VWRLVLGSLELRSVLRSFAPSALAAAAAANREQNNAESSPASADSASASSTSDAGDSKDSKDVKSPAAASATTTLSLLTHRASQKRVSVVGYGFLNPRLWEEAEKVVDKVTAALNRFVCEPFLPPRTLCVCRF